MKINMRSLLNLVAIGITNGKEVTVVCDGRGRGSSGRLLRGNSYAKVKHKKKSKKTLIIRIESAKLI